MADLEVRAENKVTLSGIGALDVEALAQAALALTSRGVPDRAELTINSSMSGQRWTIVAKWEPVIAPPPMAAPPYLKDPEPDSPAAVFPCGKCGNEIVEDAGKKSGYRHLDEGLLWGHPAQRGRPVLDTPQA